MLWELVLLGLIFMWPWWDGDRVTSSLTFPPLAKQGSCRFTRLEELPLPRTISFAEVPMKRKGDQIIEGAAEARAGFLDHRVLLVLAASPVLAAAFLALAFVGVIKL
jgi:hypothetical protein